MAIIAIDFSSDCQSRLLALELVVLVYLQILSRSRRTGSPEAPVADAGSCLGTSMVDLRNGDIWFHGDQDMGGIFVVGWRLDPV